MRRFILALFISAAAMMAAQSSAPSEEKALDAAEMQMMQAVINHDTAAWTAICDPQYRTINEDGSTADLKEALAEMRNNPLKVDGPPEMSERLVRVAGDTAFISGRWKFALPDKTTREIRYTETWVKRGGSWKFIQWQATRITPEGLEREKKFKAFAAKD